MQWTQNHKQVMYTGNRNIGKYSELSTDHAHLLFKYDLMINIQGNENKKIKIEELSNKKNLAVEYEDKEQNKWPTTLSFRSATIFHLTCSSLLQLVLWFSKIKIPL